MKAVARSLILVFLMAVICSAGYIAVLAVDPDIQGFANDDEMVIYSEKAAIGASDLEAAGSAAAPSLGVTRSRDIENAPALRLNNQVNIPATTPEDNEPEEDEEDEEEAPYAPAPHTGYEDYGAQIAAGIALICMSGVIAAGNRKHAAAAPYKA